MKNLFILTFLVSLLYSSEIKELKSFEELPSNKNVFIMFGIEPCLWCKNQLAVLETLSDIKKDFLFVKVYDKKVHEQLLQKAAFSIKYYPTSFIVIKEDESLNILYEFQGYQEKEEILKILNDEDSFF